MATVVVDRGDLSSGVQKVGFLFGVGVVGDWGGDCAGSCESGRWAR